MHCTPHGDVGAGRALKLNSADNISVYVLACKSRVECMALTMIPGNLLPMQWAIRRVRK